MKTIRCAGRSEYINASSLSPARSAGVAGPFAAAGCVAAGAGVGRGADADERGAGGGAFGLAVFGGAPSIAWRPLGVGCSAWMSGFGGGSSLTVCEGSAEGGLGAGTEITGVASGGAAMGTGRGHQTSNTATRPAFN